MSTVINLPTKASGIQLIGRPNHGGGYLIHTAKEWRVFETWSATPEGLAKDIATALQDARDAGYAQALAHVRYTLGLAT